MAMIVCVRTCYAPYEPTRSWSIRPRPPGAGGVHRHVAVQLVDWVTEKHPAVPVDRDAVLLGAALHDVGKVLHPAELTGPGSAHELAGYQLLVDRGVPAAAAVIARDHASWSSGSTVECLLVSLADKVWKDKRVDDLEQLVVDRIVAGTGEAGWAVFAGLDDELSAIGAQAVRRLAFQNSFSAGS